MIARELRRLVSEGRARELVDELLARVVNDEEEEIDFQLTRIRGHMASLTMKLEAVDGGPRARPQLRVISGEPTA